LSETEMFSFNGLCGCLRESYAYFGKVCRISAHSGTERGKNAKIPYNVLSVICKKNTIRISLA